LRSGPTRRSTRLGEYSFTKGICCPGSPADE
jgi:hypothetical protein